MTSQPARPARSPPPGQASLLQLRPRLTPPRCLSPRTWARPSVWETSAAPSLRPRGRWALAVPEAGTAEPGPASAPAPHWLMSAPGGLGVLAGGRLLTPAHVQGRAALALRDSKATWPVCSRWGPARPAFLWGRSPPTEPRPGAASSPPLPVRRPLTAQQTPVPFGAPAPRCSQEAPVNPLTLRCKRLMIPSDGFLSACSAF